jgi:hypothetical protein
VLTAATSSFLLEANSSRNDPMHFRFTIRDLLWLTLVVAMGVQTVSA